MDVNDFFLCQLSFAGLLITEDILLFFPHFVAHIFREGFTLSKTWSQTS